MRISNQWMVNSFMRTLGRNYNELSKVTEQISSGRAYTTPSQAPTANALAMHHKTEINEHMQYISNIDRVTEWLDTTDSAMTDIESTLQRARELAVEGANDTLVQADRDAIAKEIDQLLQHMLDIANTNVGGEYLFAGDHVTTKPFGTVDGQKPNQMTDIVTFSEGLTRSGLNLLNILDVAYVGNEKRFATEIEKGTTLTRNVPGSDVFFRGKDPNPAPTFRMAAPTLSTMLPVQALNNGRGMQAGSIILTDENGVETWVDLSSARRIDDVIFAINQTRGFTAGLEEVPSDTAVALGIYKTAGPTNTLIGLSDPKMLSVNTPLSDLQSGTGVPKGFLAVNLRDGSSLRIDLSAANTIGDVVNTINAAAPSMLRAEFDLVHNRLQMTDLSGGTGDFSVESKKNQLYVKDLPARVGDDLGIVKNVGAGDTILSDFDPALLSEGTELKFLNDGKGVEKGYLRITGRDGVARTVNLTQALTMQDVLTQIGVQTGGAQQAALDANTHRMVITDYTIGGGEFKIEEVDGLGAPPVPLAVQVREATTVANRLGLLKFSQGATVVGDSVGIGVTGATPLSGFVPQPEVGQIVIWDTNGAAHEVDLSNARTVQDIVDKINATSPLQATFDTTDSRFIITDTTRPVGAQGLRVEERTNTARDLGLIGNINHYSTDTLTGEGLTIKNLPTLVGGIDLNPAVTGATELAALNNNRTFNKGVNLGLVRITDKAGHFQTIDFRGAKTVQDVLDRINNPANGIYVKAKINARGDGIEIIDGNHGARGRLEVFDVDGTCAADLGIAGSTVDTRLIGADIDPAITDKTVIGALNGGKGMPLGTVYVQSGEFSGTIDLTGVKTVGDLMDRMTTADPRFNLTAWVDGDGKRINLTNTKGQGFIKVRDQGEPEQASASAAGFGASRSIFETLTDLRDNLLRNDNVAVSEQSIKVLDEDLKRVLQWHAETGARTNRATDCKEKLTTNKLNLNKMLDVVENVDVAEAMTRLTQLQTAFQAALQAGSRVLQLTLSDYLR